MAANEGAHETALAGAAPGCEANVGLGDVEVAEVGNRDAVEADETAPGGASSEMTSTLEVSRGSKAEPNACRAVDDDDDDDDDDDPGSASVDTAWPGAFDGICANTGTVEEIEAAEATGSETPAGNDSAASDDDTRDDDSAGDNSAGRDRAGDHGAGGNDDGEEGSDELAGSNGASGNDDAVGGEGTAEGAREGEAEGPAKGEYHRDAGATET